MEQAVKPIPNHFSTVCRRVKGGWKWHLLSGEVAVASGTSKAEREARQAAAAEKRRIITSKTP